VIWINDLLVSPGIDPVYGEKIIQGHRFWDPKRSKLSALYHIVRTADGMDNIIPDLTSSMRVLYLGAAHGSTVSHIADYVEVVYSIDSAPSPMQDLLAVAQRRINIIPILADATNPGSYAPLVERVHLIYQDIAQPSQAEIAFMHTPFLIRGGTLVLMLKARSVDVRKDPVLVVSESCAYLEQHGLDIQDRIWLSPYHHDHAAIICKKQENGIVETDTM
jgi:fibrillarin-like pre-rRNA processing protein